MMFSPLFSLPWVSTKDLAVLVSLATLATLISRVREEISVFTSLISLSYVMIAAYKSIGPFISSATFAVGIILWGWIPVRGALETLGFWLMLLLPVSLVVVFSGLGPSEGAYLTLLVLLVAMALTYMMNLEDLRSLIRGEIPKSSGTDLMEVSTKLFELFFYLFVIFVAVHEKALTSGLISMLIGLIIRRVTSRRSLAMFITSILMALIYYIS